MVADVADILLDDSDAQTGDPTEALAGAGAPTAERRGRGRPRGSGSGPRQRRAREASAARPSNSGATGARELANLFKQLIGAGSLVLAMFVGVDEAAMTPDEAGAISRPLARILIRSGWATQVLRAADKGGDWIALLIASAGYALRVYPLIVQRQEILSMQRAHQQHYANGGNRGTSGTPSGVRAQANQAGQPAPAGQAGGSVSDYGSASAYGATDPASVAAVAAVAGGAGLADPDVLTARAYGDVAGMVAPSPY